MHQEEGKEEDDSGFLDCARALVILRWQRFGLAYTSEPPSKLPFSSRILVCKEAAAHALGAAGLVPTQQDVARYASCMLAGLALSPSCLLLPTATAECAYLLPASLQWVMAGFTGLSHARCLARLGARDGTKSLLRKRLRSELLAAIAAAILPTELRALHQLSCFIASSSAPVLLWRGQSRKTFL